MQTYSIHIFLVSVSLYNCHGNDYSLGFDAYKLTKVLGLLNGIFTSIFSDILTGLGEVLNGTIMGTRDMTLRTKEVSLVSTHNKEIFKC